MENASKALIIAAGALIGIMLLTLLAYGINKMGSNSARVYAEMEKNRITQFNQKFLNYDGRGTKVDDNSKPINPLNAQDVMTIINFNENNQVNGDASMYVDIQIYGKDGHLISSETKNFDVMQNLDKVYKCEVMYATGNNRELIGTVKITELN